MKRRGSDSIRGGDPSQLRIQWSERATAAGPRVPTIVSPPALEPEQALVQRLPWDFKESFPPPLPEALDAGILSDEDVEPENIRAIHDEQGRQLLATLRDLNFIGDARRRLFDPRTGKSPADPEGKALLQKRLFGEAQRLELWWQTLIDTYAEAFGEEAANAFGKAIRARNAGIDVVAETRPEFDIFSPEIQIPEGAAAPVIPAQPPIQEPPQKPQGRNPPHPRTVTARFPVPRPLLAAILAGNFGRDEAGVVRPSAAEVRAITLQHSEKLIDILESIKQARHSCVPNEVNRLQESFRCGVAAYAEDFGKPAAEQLEAFCRRQAHLRATESGHGPRH
jgi:hypothetical protein